MNTAMTKRESRRTCLYCHREYRCWASSDELDGLCSEKCEKALNALYGEPEPQQMYIGKPVTTQDGCILWWEDTPSQMLQQAWATLQSIPSYVEAQARAFAEES